MRRYLKFQALDGADVSFPVPKGVNAYLAQRAIEKVHRGVDEDAVVFGLTHDETAFVAEVIARLEEHKAKAVAS